MSDAAVANIVTGVVTVATLLVGFFTLWIKLRYGVNKVQEAREEAATRADETAAKIDANTEITRVGAAAAVESAQKLNGGVDSAVVNAMAPIHKALMEHIAQNTRDIGELKRVVADLKTAMADFVSSEKLKEFSDYIHKRNHDMLNVLTAQDTKVELILKKMEQRQP